MLKAIRADITTLQVNAVVNAANERLQPGGGVCGAIHRAAGPELEAECMKIGSCPTGEVRITNGYSLPARYVIHAVGPVWKGGGQGEELLLASCYRESLRIAAEYGLNSIAFPCISTGTFGYPREKAAAVAVKTVNEMKPACEVVFCCFSEDDLALYRKLLDHGA